ncbi:uncharacterized [Tachysurus ichikawai]
MIVFTSRHFFFPATSFLVVSLNLENATDYKVYDKLSVAWVSRGLRMRIEAVRLRYNRSVCSRRASSWHCCWETDDQSRARLRVRDLRDDVAASDSPVPRLNP